MLGPYKFSLQVSVDHHGYSMNSGHYKASINCCGKHLIVTMIKLLNVISRIPIIHLLPIYLLQTHKWNVRAAICPEGRLSSLALSIVECLQPDRGGWELIDFNGAGTVVCLFTTSRGVGTETCGMDNVFPPDDQ